MSMNVNAVMLIGKQWKLRDIQNAFQNEFPFLKIEFYKPKTKQGSNEKSEKLNPSLPVITLNSGKVPAEISIMEDKSVSDIKSVLKEILDCNILIYRKSGNHWIETSYTEDWTLKQQNEEGKLMSEV